jgi:hypothetical protein
VVDLYAIHFDPVFRTQDFASYVHDSMPLEILDQMNLGNACGFAGGPLQRFIASRWLRNKDSVAVAKFIRAPAQANQGRNWTRPRAWPLCSRVLLHFPDLEGLVRQVFACGMPMP